MIDVWVLIKFVLSFTEKHIEKVKYEMKKTNKTKPKPKKHDGDRFPITRAPKMRAFRMSGCMLQPEKVLELYEVTMSLGKDVDLFFSRF